MTTLPPEPPPAPAGAPHRQRQVTEAFGADATRYDRARPGYPAALADRIDAASPGRDVLDAGCGTGIAARLFQAAGRRVLGLDPTAADGMRSAGGFGPPERWQLDWERPYTRAEWLDVVPTLGGQGQPPPAVLGELLAGMGAAIDAAGGGFTMAYTTVVVTAARTAAG